MIVAHIYAEEHVILSNDPVVRMLSRDLEGIEVQIIVTRRNVPCTLAVVWEHGETERSGPEAHPEG